ncbi:MAG: IclR family transcriptional regulator [Hydrogenophaga sp.]|uniref:IclR family transcriptional regulator n=1 Tax=Hydrogenophaga sp. TaxID=1904254 RepID=UPI0025B89E16|nr:IclR family transcriptional regulator [Hydrogenophaga sp.]MBU7572607.1 IclR family transcriptional regulator [Hydrogenophaga sp.]
MSSLMPVVGRTLSVFEVFARERRELSNLEIARLLGVPESSCSDLLHTLHTMGYLRRSPGSRRFYPSGRLHEVARQVKENDSFTLLAREAVDQLAQRTNESAFFGVLDRHAAKVAAAQPSRLRLRYILDEGERVALHASALGKALLGALPPDALAAELDHLRLRAVTSDTVLRPDTLSEQLARGREAGWYETRGEGIEGVRALAVSGWLNGQPVALSLAGPIARMDRHQEIYLQALQEARSALLADDETTT